PSAGNCSEEPCWWRDEVGQTQFVLPEAGATAWAAPSPLAPDETTNDRGPQGVDGFPADGDDGGRETGGGDTGWFSREGADLPGRTGAGVSRADPAGPVTRGFGGARALAAGPPGKPDAPGRAPWRII